MDKPFCRAEARRFDTGASRGLGKHYTSRCECIATHDPDGDGVFTRCWTHSKAAADKRRAKREAGLQSFMMEVERRKNKARSK